MADMMSRSAEETVITRTPYAPAGLVFPTTSTWHETESAVTALTRTKQPSELIVPAAT